MGLPKPEHLPHYTYDDYKIWEGNWELINGIPFAMMPAPSVYHQEINGNLYATVRQALSSCGRCKAILPIDWKISDDTVVQPDLSILCNSTETGAFITKAPSVVFEILSPSTATKDRTIKFDLYESHGVLYFVLINPLQKSIELFRLLNGKYVRAAETSGQVFDFDLTKDAGCRFTLDLAPIW